MLPLPYILFPCLKSSALSSHVYWGDPPNGSHEYSGMAADTYWLESFFGFYDSTTTFLTKIIPCLLWKLLFLVVLWEPEPLLTPINPKCQDLIYWGEICNIQQKHLILWNRINLEQELGVKLIYWLVDHNPGLYHNTYYSMYIPDF